MSDRPTSTKLQRWLDLIAFLVGRHFPVSVEEIMDGVPAYLSPHDSDDATALDSSRKMFERDKAELRDMGIPLETVTFTTMAETTEGYRLKERDFYLPYLELIGHAREPGEPRRMGIASFQVDEDEASDAGEALARVANMPAMPLIREARSALRKLAFDLPIESGATELWVEHPDAAAVRDRLIALAGAVTRRKRVRFRYHGIYRGESTERDVAGYGLLFLRGHWYMVGHDALREAVRIFRVDRMEAEKVETRRPREPDYEIPEDLDLAAYRDKEAWELGDGAPVEALVRFRFPRSLWAERNAHGEPVREEDAGAAIRAFRVHQVNPFLRWILTQEGDAEIVAPPEMRSALAAMAAEVAALYRREPAG